MKPGFTVAMLGARMNYAIPRILYANNMLEHFYTDITSATDWPAILKAIPSPLLPETLRRLKARCPEDIPPDKITAFPSFGVNYARNISSADSKAERTEIYTKGGKTFCDLVTKRGFHDAGAVFTFNSAGLEILREAKKQGLRTCMEQTIAPKQIEQKILSAEADKFPGWEDVSDSNAAEYAERELMEWAESDLIICGSEYVKEGIAQCGGPTERCVVVPYGVNIPSSAPAEKKHDGPLRVLTVGTVCLRKGPQYTMQAAKEMSGKAEFRIVGPISISDSARDKISNYVELTGPIERTEIHKHYEWADVFLLPSMCEGSATVIYEAMGHGLPIICTPNSGSQVQHEVSGFVVPAGDPTPLIESIEKLASDKDILLRMSEAALKSSDIFTLKKYGGKIIETLRTASC